MDGVRANFSRANSAANILEENNSRDIHPTIKITNLTSSSSTSSSANNTTATTTVANGHLRRSYLSVNCDDDVVWKRKSELNLNNKEENEFIHHHHQYHRQQPQHPTHHHLKKNVYNGVSQQSFNDFSNEHIITIPSTTTAATATTTRKCINTKAQMENNYLVWITPVAAR